MKIIMLVGIPCSGKTTFAKTHFPDYVRISQDDLGSKEKCFKLFDSCIRQNKNIIIDRCNHTKKQRKEWINRWFWHRDLHTMIRNDIDLSCVYFSISKDNANIRIQQRSEHPTIPKEMPLDKKRKIVLRFFNELEIPTLEEPFSSILHIRS